MLRLFGFIAALLMVSGPASAHRLNESYIYFNVTDTSLAGRFEATLPDIDAALDVDADGDGTVSEAELRANADRIFAFFEDRLFLSHAGQSYEITPSEVGILGSAVGQFAQIGFDVPELSQVPEAIDIVYLPMGDVLGEGHLGYILIESNPRLDLEGNERYVSLAFDQSGAVQSLSLVGEPSSKIFLDFVAEGVWTLWEAADFLAFVIVFSLSTVLMLQAGQWARSDRFDLALGRGLRLWVALALGHAVALALASFTSLGLEIWVAETAVALSIIAMAVLNLTPRWQRLLVWAVVVCGLAHGFFYANELELFGLARSQLGIGVAGFTFGFSLAVLALLVVLIPVLWGLSRVSFYVPAILQVGSVLFLAIGTLWVLERATAFELNVRALLAMATGGGA